jgi:tetratricopeptide (TPR) repeat protein
MKSLLFAFIVTVISSSSAFADANKDEAKKIVNTAVVSFNLGKYEDAASQYEAAYSLVPDPALLFNIGQCYRLAEKPEKAQIAYRSYLRTSPESAPNRDIAEKRLQEIADTLATKVAPSPVIPVPLPTPVVEDRKEAPAFDDITTQEVPPAPVAAKSHTLVWIASAVTAALAVSATVASLTARSRYNSLKGGCGVAGTCTDSEVNGVSSMATTANVLWISSALAAAGTGTALYFTW